MKFARKINKLALKINKFYKKNLLEKIIWIEKTLA
jgi:hypothetical protein